VTCFRILSQNTPESKEENTKSLTIAGFLVGAPYRVSGTCQIQGMRISVVSSSSLCYVIDMNYVEGSCEYIGKKKQSRTTENGCSTGFVFGREANFSLE
jgi:hypothetical protein